MKKRHILTAAILAIGGIGLIVLPASAQDQANQPAQSSSGSAAQSAGAQQGQAAQQGQSAAAGAQTASDRSGQASSAAISQSDAQKVLSQSSQAIISRDGVKGLSQQLSQRDQQRLGDLSKDSQQLSQSLDQLRQAYKDKYGKDLDLSSNADQVFTMAVFTIPADVSGQAQPAAARQTPGASDQAASATGDQAAAPKSSFIVVPASAGQTEARVALVNEDGQWKIDVPDSMDAKQLDDKLNTQIQQTVASKDQWPADATQGQQAIARAIIIAFAQPSAGASGDAGAGSNAAGAGGTSGSSSGTGTSGSSSGGTSGQNR
jgi:hypothetical protein